MKLDNLRYLLLVFSHVVPSIANGVGQLYRSNLCKMTTKFRSGKAIFEPIQMHVYVSAKMVPEDLGLVVD